MPRRRKGLFFALLGFLGPLCALGADATGEYSVSSGEATGVRVWVRPAEHHEPAGIRIQFQLEDSVSADGNMMVPCHVTVDLGLDNPRARLGIFDAEDTALFEGVTPLPSESGASQLTFEWPLEDVADGVYRARIAIVHAFGQTVAWRDIMLEKLTYPRLAQSLQDLRHATTLLGPYIGDPPDADLPAYARLRYAVAVDALHRAEAFVLKGQWPAASESLRFGHSSIDSARALLTFAPLVPEMSAPVLTPAPEALEIRQGAFYASGIPLFLFGIRDTALEPRTLPVLRRYGLNFASIEVSPADILQERDVNQAAIEHLETYLDAAGGLGLGVTVGLGTQTAPAWMPARERSETGGAAFAADHRQARAVSQRLLEALSPVLKERTWVNGVSLAFEPSFRWDSEDIRKGFQEAVARSYGGDRRAVNRNWRTRLRTLDEIEILWDYDRASYQYEWQTWHQHVVSDHFAWLSAQSERVLPGLPRQIALRGACLEPGETRGGIDRQALAKITDVSACTAHYTGDATSYALPFPHPEVTYRLLRSLAPESPLMVISADFDANAMGVGAAASRYVHAAMWEAAVAGVNGCAVPAGAFWEHPERIEGFAAASVDLNRLGTAVTALQRADAPIAILWSMPSRIYHDGRTFLASVRRAYEGSAFFGYPVRFVTEEECIAGALDDVAVLVVPEVPALSNETFQAIDAYVKAGGAIARSGRPAPYTPTGSSRHDVITQTNRTVFVRASDTATVYLHALDAAYTFGVLPVIPRTINSFGYPLEGVKSRYVELDGEQYLYLVNLRKKPVRAYLHGGPRQGRDLVQGRDVRFPQMLEPLDPMLVLLAPRSSMPSSSENAAVLAARDVAGAEIVPAQSDSVILSPIAP